MPEPEPFEGLIGGTRGVVRPCAIEDCDDPGDILLLSRHGTMRVRVCTRHSDAMDSNGFHMADPRNVQAQ